MPKNPYVRLVLICVPALVLVWCGAIGSMFLLSLLALNPLEVLAIIGVLALASIFADLIWNTYFRWASKEYVPEFHQIWFPPEE